MIVKNERKFVNNFKTFKKLSYWVWQLLLCNWL